MDITEAPADPAGDATNDPSGNRRSLWRPLTILVVDDEPNIREIVQLTAIRAGHRVVSAENGAIAWELLTRNEEIDVVVSDVMMPQIEALS